MAAKAAVLKCMNIKFNCELCPFYRILLSLLLTNSVYEIYTVVTEIKRPNGQLRRHSYLAEFTYYGCKMNFIAKLHSYR
jgi:hypothetical protein